MRITAALLTLLAIAACSPVSGPPGQPSSSDVNPISGNRGGSGTK